MIYVVITWDHNIPWVVGPFADEAEAKGFITEATPEVEKLDEWGKLEIHQLWSPDEARDTLTQLCRED